MSTSKMSNHKYLKNIGLTLTLLAFSANAPGSTTTLSDAPLVTSTGASVLPNILFVLDDSGSMDWDYLPDWANDNNAANIPYLFRNADFNGVAYNPGINYLPPVKSDGTSYPSMTSAATTGWTIVPNDGYGIQSTADSNLVGNAYFYTVIPGEYCSAPTLKSCISATAPSTSNPYPAKLRWCNSSALTTCQSINTTATYKFWRLPTPLTATIPVSVSANTQVTSIKVGGIEILSAASPTAASNNSTTVASSIVANINACTTAKTGSCGGVGYIATVSGSNTITIQSPGTTTSAPVIVQTGTTLTPTVFARNIAGSAGDNLRTDIVSTNNSYPYPGSTTKAAARTDCAGTTCTYAEAMTNYANWWTYYHTRMQMMKTSASFAFSPLNANYRVGYMSINDNTGSDFLNPSAFTTTQKGNWYTKLTNAQPNNSTPLRTALTKAGRLYAGKLNGTTLNGSTVTDPMQYSCQQNFTILSTDGYWNESSNPNQIDGSTDIGNQDSYEPRPWYDGTIVGNTTTTTVITSTTPTTTVVQKQTLTGQSISTPYTRNVISTSAAKNCSTGGSTASMPCLQDNGVNGAGSIRTWCMDSAAAGAECASSTFGSTVYACRGKSNSTNLPQGGSPNTGCVTDGNGQQWCIYPNNTTTGTTSCSVVLTGNSLYVCKPPSATNGYTVTTQPQTSTRVATQSVTSIDNTTTTTTRTVKTTNGVVTSDTTSSPSTTTANVSSATTPLTDTGVPTGSSTWSNGTSSSVCMATPTPAAGTSTTSTATSGTSTTTTTSGPTTTTLSTVGPTVGATTSTTSSTSTTTASSGGTSNTLADTAEYYYVTDLRTPTLGNCTSGSSGNTLCSTPAISTDPDPYNNVPSSGLDGASWQHMTTFTLGLGASGDMQYTSDYATASSGDYYDVHMGTTANGTLCSWQASGACNWPTPTSNTQTTIDDLWHAGVNGRGAYFSAHNPTSLSASLSSALAGVSARLGASAAATTSNPNVTTGDNFVFTSTFISMDWTGQLVRQTLDLATGVVSSTADWTARSQLDALPYASRTIYTFDTSGGTGSNNLKLFTYANLTTAEQAYFNMPYIYASASDLLTQFCPSGASCLSAADQTAAQGTNLVNFLRGDRSNEGTTDPAKYYRTRPHVLGDIVDAEAAYIKQPVQNFTDHGYSDYVTAQNSRVGMVYIAANDGMLHAIKAGGSTVATGDGVEQWAYVPAAMLPTLYQLADKTYSTIPSRHRFFVDGTPTQGDICTLHCGSTDTSPATWKTILVGGYNAGGRGYYALDVTDPANPKAMWEFNNANMGYSYGNPKIVKLSDGTWVVLVTSGYNNVPPYAPSGDGQGHLYVLNANTGALIREISTGVGSATTTVTGCSATPCPSGLSKIAARVVNPGYDNTVLAVYGGDLYGNVWRFDVNGNIGATGYDAQLLATLVGPTGSIQPVTSKPEIGVVDNQVVVFVGTGSYLGSPDVTDPNPKIQSMYAIKDTLLATTSYGSPRATTCATPTTSTPTPPNCFVKQTYTSTTCPKGTRTSVCTTGQKVTTTTSKPVTFATQYGWYADYPTAGERSNTDPILVLGNLLFTTNIPDTTACTAGGYSFLYFVDYRDGSSVSTSPSNIAGVQLGNSLATRPVVVHLPNGSIVVEIMMAAPAGNSASGSGSGSGSGTGSSQGCIGGDCDAPPPVTETPPLGTASGNPRRASWRELINER